MKVLPNRSYEVQANSGQTYRRNRRHLRGSKESEPQQLKTIAIVADDCDVSVNAGRSSGVPEVQGGQSSRGTQPIELKTLPSEQGGTPPSPSGQWAAQRVTRSGGVNQKAQLLTGLYFLVSCCTGVETCFFVLIEGRV